MFKFFRKLSITMFYGFIPFNTVTVTKKLPEYKYPPYWR